MWLVLGDRKPVPFRTEDYFYYYRVLKAAFLTWMARFDPQVPPEPDLGGSYGRWTSHARTQLDASDHLSRVATITAEQIRKMQAAGIHTLTALATTTLSRIPKLDDAIFARLREQAQLQGASAVNGAAQGGTSQEGDDQEERKSPRQELAESLLAQIPPLIDGFPADAERWRLQTFLAHVVEFHRREDKPIWWTMFDRHAMTEEELCEDLNCLGGLQRLDRPPEKIRQSFGFWYMFDPDQNTKLEVGSRCYFAHDLTVQIGVPRVTVKKTSLSSF